jgi:hypothetical protein
MSELLPLDPAVASDIIEQIQPSTDGSYDPEGTGPYFTHITFMELTASRGYDMGGLLSTIIREVQTLRERIAAVEAGAPLPPSSGPTVVGLVPDTAVCGSADFTLNVHGTGFDETSVINWNNVDVPTAYVDTTNLRMYVSPASWTQAVSVPVIVRTGAESSEPMLFHFTLS